MPILNAGATKSIKATRTKTFNGKRYVLWGIEATEKSAKATTNRLRKAPWSASAVKIIRLNRVSWGVYYRD